MAAEAGDAPQRVLHGRLLGQRSMADVSERRQLPRGQHRIGGAARVCARQCTKSRELDGDRQREREHGGQGVQRFEPALVHDAAGLERLVELLKTVDDFDFTYQSTVKLSLLGSALSPDFVTDGRSLILHGKPGRGKTHVAIAIGYRAIQNGLRHALRHRSRAHRGPLCRVPRGSARRRAHALRRTSRLVCDEVGYLTYGPDAANVLYHVVTKRHLATSAMVFTSNKHPDDWGTVLHDDDLAATIVDRVLERGRLLRLDGPSIRTKHLGRDALVLDEG
jgi:DNA replication protein DnaC